MIYLCGLSAYLVTDPNSNVRGPLRWRWTFCHFPSRLFQMRVSSDWCEWAIPCLDVFGDYKYFYYLNFVVKSRLDITWCWKLPFFTANPTNPSSSKPYLIPTLPISFEWYPNDTQWNYNEIVTYLSTYWVNRTYAMHAVSSPSKWTWGLRIVVLIAR